MSYIFIRWPEHDTSADLAMIDVWKRYFAGPYDHELNAEITKEMKMGKKRWMWDGQEMEYGTFSGHDSHHWLRSTQPVHRNGDGHALMVRGESLDDLYANARKAGCVEVVEPVRCHCLGSVRPILTMSPTMSTWQVCCDLCCTSGPAKLSERQAVEAWNDLVGRVRHE